jgi:hypothetical protein
METKKTIPVQGSPMTFTGLWGEDKVFGPEGAVLEVMDSAFYPVLTHERWVMHNNMWTFIPTGEGLL